MDQRDPSSYEKRLRDLEAAVADLQRAVGELGEILRVQVGAREPRPSHPPMRAATTTAAPRRRPPTATPEGIRPGLWRWLTSRGPQFWISRLGIGLVLLAAVFLFDYAVDQGWLTPGVRVAIGLVLGALLAGLGLGVQHKERWFAQLMLGGAAATWYITGFAAFQILEIVSYPVAFTFMVAVTVYTFSMGIRQDESVLGVLGVIGGVGTPFLLYTEHGSIPALVSYTCLVVLGTSAIYLLKGWRSLLWTSFVGGWAVLALALDGAEPDGRWAVQVGVTMLWLLFWWVAAARSLLESANAAEWKPPQTTITLALSKDDFAAGPHASSALITVATPLIALWFSRSTWEVSDTVWGILAAGVTLMYAGSAAAIRRRSQLRILGSAHAVGAAVLAAAACALLFAGDVLILLWTALAMALLYLGRSFDEGGLAACGHLLSGVVAVWLLQRLTGEGRPEVAVVTGRGLSDAAVIAAILISSQWSRRELQQWFLVAAYLGTLGWLWRELSVLPGGDAVVTAAYGVMGLILLLAPVGARKAGLATLLIAVAKLFLVDLDRVDPFLRILLFLGFGGLFLGISYYYRDRSHDSDPAVKPPRD